MVLVNETGKKKYAPLDAMRGRDDPSLANDRATAYVTIVILKRYLRILRTTINFADDRIRHGCEIRDRRNVD